MKKQGAQRPAGGISRRTRNIGIAAILGVLLVGCTVFFESSNNPKNDTKVASINTPLPSTATSQPEPTTVPTGTPTIAPTKTFAPLPTEPISTLNSCLPANAKIENATVTKIVDGDTVDVEIDGKPFTVRYIGIDTPETKDPNLPIQFYGPEAANRNSELVSGKQVILVKDVSETDSYGRLLRYVFVGDVFVNETLVKEGYAYAKDFPPDTSCSELFSVEQERVKSQSIGLWANNARYDEIAVATETPITSAEGCPQGCLEQKPGCDIKGNISFTSGDKIYHVKGLSRSYEKTVIDPSNGERWFCTVEEAEANGWRAPRN